jgi:hypothetical protein
MGYRALRMTLPFLERCLNDLPLEEPAVEGQWIGKVLPPTKKSIQTFSPPYIGSFPEPRVTDPLFECGLLQGPECHLRFILMQSLHS